MRKQMILSPRDTCCPMETGDFYQHKWKKIKSAVKTEWSFVIVCWLKFFSYHLQIELKPFPSLIINQQRKGWASYHSSNLLVIKSPNDSIKSIKRFITVPLLSWRHSWPNPRLNQFTEVQELRPLQRRWCSALKSTSSPPSLPGSLT